MKVLLDIDDDKVIYFLEVLKGFNYVCIEFLSEEKVLFISELKVVVLELKDIRVGKKFVNFV